MKEKACRLRLYTLLIITYKFFMLNYLSTCYFIAIIRYTCLIWLFILFRQQYLNDVWLGVNLRLDKNEQAQWSDKTHVWKRLHDMFKLVNYSWFNSQPMVVLWLLHLWLWKVILATCKTINHYRLLLNIMYQICGSKRNITLKFKLKIMANNNTNHLRHVCFRHAYERGMHMKYVYADTYFCHCIRWISLFLITSIILHECGTCVIIENFFTSLETNITTFNKQITIYYKLLKLQ